MKAAAKMAELRAEAPLAKSENDEDFGEFSDFQSSQDVENSNVKPLKPREVPNDNAVEGFSENFNETFSGSLEDLVNSFDEKITKCFSNFEENVEEMAPVQVRSQEEIMNDCQMWWTITGNFGNILPIDWAKSHARKLHMPALNLNDKQAAPADDGALSEEDEAVASDLDIHSLILAGVQAEPPDRLKTADEVIKEIDDIMDEAESDESPELESPDSAIGESRERPPLASREKLEAMSSAELNELYLDLELMIKDYSEVLINELAFRDELEYEKELKNQFISLLLTIQNKRRQYNVEKKKKNKNGQTLDAKYLTTVIPYTVGTRCPNNATLQILIKILRAIDEDSPTVPTLLTDYILKGRCLLAGLVRRVRAALAATRSADGRAATATQPRPTPE
ncbi:Fasciculation and elongation protein zeta-2 [Amphibalanus amphitrite]|uniref:Fasciculation and elongation protein zeta-2 n=1 Tax=Amphibalanus amphitrite TaxID=1232801 RepID=A0A6A4X1Z0_AMPAM|nr:Fasciculation and elongation protein zeta-2 [Amphibalanus amphitrite]